MARREYKTVALPARPKGRGRNVGERVAEAMAGLINAEAARGWSYIGADVVHTEARRGLLGSEAIAVTVLVFEREAEDAVREPTPMRANGSARPAARFEDEDADPRSAAAPTARREGARRSLFERTDDAGFGAPSRGGARGVSTERASSARFGAQDDDFEDEAEDDEVERDDDDVDDRRGDARDGYFGARGLRRRR